MTAGEDIWIGLTRIRPAGCAKRARGLRHAAVL